MSPVRSTPGQLATLGSSARARVILSVWCKDCHHRAKPDPVEQVERYGAEMTLLDWKARLVCSQCGSRDIDMVVTSESRPDF